MNGQLGSTLAGILMAAFCIGASEEAGPPPGSGVLWEARTMAAQARQQLQAAAHAARAGDAEKFGAHEAKAKEMFAEARQLFEQAGGMRLDDAEALVDYAGVLQAQNDADLAAKALRRATRIEPEDPDVWLALGRGLLTPLYRRPDEAARALERAAEAGAGGRVEGAARAVLGRLYWDKGLFDFGGGMEPASRLRPKKSPSGSMPPFSRAAATWPMRRNWFRRLPRHPQTLSWWRGRCSARPSRISSSPDCGLTTPRKPILRMPHSSCGREDMRRAWRPLNGRSRLTRRTIAWNMSGRYMPTRAR